MKRGFSIGLLLLIGVVQTVFTHAQATGEYGSLEEFCLKNQADTPANCACGQATADAILSIEEQALALSMMGGRQPPSFDSVDAHDAFMDKLARVTRGCDPGGAETMGSGQAQGAIE